MKWLSYGDDNTDVLLIDLLLPYLTLPDPLLTISTLKTGTETSTSRSSSLLCHEKSMPPTRQVKYSAVSLQQVDV